MKSRLTLIASFLISFSLFAQAQYDPSKVNKKASALYDQAIEKAQGDQYQEAIGLLLQAIEKDPNYVDAYLSLAGVYGQIKDRQRSIQYYDKAFALDSNYTSDFRLPYAINQAGLGQFDQALATINHLLSKPNLSPNTLKAANYRKQTFEFAVDFAKKHPANGYVFAPKNLGDGVNTSESEYFPSMPIDGKVLVFTRRLNSYNEDFFLSLKKNDQWTKAYKLPGDINTPENEGAQNISQDGTWMVFTGCNRKDGYGSCDLYISYLTSEGWTAANNMGNKINSEFWDSQPSLSPDKRDLYFASRRPGGYGGSDIYVSHLQANGKWSEPENMGPEINTAGDESAPFIHADNQTLFFTSTGLPGYGDEDIYFARKGADGKWGKPQNLGYPINTIDHEGTLFIEANGITAYYASDRADSKGGLDIYSFELPEFDRPFKTLWVKGKVFDQHTRKGIPSSVELIDLATKQTISKVQTDETGNYLITLPTGKDYAFNVNRQGYLFYSDNYSLKDKSPDSTYQKDIPLQPIEVNASVVLRNIFFDVNKYDLKTTSQVELDRVADLLRQNPTLKIQIEGHTDNAGSPAENQKLSEHRAQAVVAYLISKGISASRLAYKGFGETKPIADNKTEEGRAQNRRTELKVTSR
jgi:outer membrane protein OmpA-like peptidoglycan-associated protein/tetratricopeptide (TPR) repeat protein